jgi:hypothetical protein
MPRLELDRLAAEIGERDGIGPEEIAVLGRGAVGQELGGRPDLDLAGHGAVGCLGRIHARISNRNSPRCVGRTWVGSRRRFVPS